MPAGLNDGAARVAAFLDIGTNSVRLLVVRVHPNGSYTVLTQQKEVVRLGEGEFPVQALQARAMERALFVCRHFAAIARALDAREIIAVATSAVREAENQAVFARRFRRATRLDLHVVSGREEARLIYLGVAGALHLGPRQALFLDIGGGSTELAVGTQRGHRFLDSLKLGAIRLGSLFPAVRDDGRVPPARYRALQRHIRGVAAPVLRRLRRYRVDLLVGSSGTILNLADVACRRFERRRLQPNDTLSLRRLRKVIRFLGRLTLAERRAVAGLNPDRADIILAGAAILETLMDELGLDTVQVSDRSLRDGLLADYIARRRRGAWAPLSVRARSVLRLGRLCGFDEAHAARISRLALALFDELRRLGLHPLGAWERELLEYATRLHDIGVFLSFTNHHLHSHYLIRHADLIGFDQREIEILAATALFHRKLAPRPKHPEFRALDRRARRVVEVLSLCLKMAESLDRGHDGNVRAVRCSRPETTRVRLTLVAARDGRFERWALEHHQSAFADVFGCRLEVGTRRAGRPARRARPAGSPMARRRPRR